jgi:murein L,D-transpeptidase YcbB/YkuD
MRRGAVRVAFFAAAGVGVCLLAGSLIFSPKAAVRELAKYLPRHAAPVDPLARVPAADRPVAAELRGLVRGELERFVAHPGTRAAIRNFYRERAYAPLWIDRGAANLRAETATEYFRGVGSDGLNPADYPIPTLSSQSDPRQLASAELQLTNSLLRFARDARGGRIELVKADRSIGYQFVAPRSHDVLVAVSKVSDVKELLDSFQPQHVGYRALKSKLAAFRVGTLQPDMVVDARRMPPLTLPEDLLIANLERWRWMPRDFGTAHVTVNIPDFSLRLVRDGRTTFRANVVVGQPSWPTPIMSAEMTSITVNPVWNVPQSIVDQELMPMIRSDPSFAKRIGLQTVEREDGSVRMYQAPGDLNVLGRFRFNFPNRFTVYQHDTPEPFLFDLASRANSHGCIRVQRATEYATALLSIARPDEGFTPARLRALRGENEVEIDFSNRIPVHLIYLTAFVDDGERLIVRDDIYGHDVRLVRALKRVPQEVAAVNRAPAQSTPAQTQPTR